MNSIFTQNFPVRPETFGTTLVCSNSLHPSVHHTLDCAKMTKLACLMRKCTVATNQTPIIFARRTQSPGLRHRGKWHRDASSRLGTLKICGTLGRGLRPLFGEGAGSPSNTKSPGLRPSSIPSVILVHPAVWSQ